MTLSAENDMRRREGLYELRSDVVKRLSDDAHVRLDARKRLANLARAGTDAFDRVVDYENHANALICDAVPALPSVRASAARSHRRQRRNGVADQSVSMI